MDCILTLTKVKIDKCFHNMSEASCSQMQSIKENRERNVIYIYSNKLFEMLYLKNTKTGASETRKRAAY